MYILVCDCVCVCNHKINVPPPLPPPPLSPPSYNDNGFGRTYAVGPMI